MLTKMLSKETKQAANEDIIYIAVEDEDLVREIYFRKSDCRNDRITLRNYIPPQLHARFMALSEICKEKRAANSNLKTQVRFGRKDLEVFVKVKGQNEPFKKEDLENFTDTKALPMFDHNILWGKK